MVNLQFFHFFRGAKTPGGKSAGEAIQISFSLSMGISVRQSGIPAVFFGVAVYFEKIVAIEIRRLFAVGELRARIVFDVFQLFDVLFQKALSQQMVDF